MLFRSGTHQHDFVCSALQLANAHLLLRSCNTNYSLLRTFLFFLLLQPPVPFHDALFTFDEPFNISLVSNEYHDGYRERKNIDAGVGAVKNHDHYRECNSTDHAAERNISARKKSYQKYSRADDKGIE